MRLVSGAFLFLAGVAAAAAAGAAFAGDAPSSGWRIAQMSPPADVPDQPGESDAAGLVLRIDRLENQLRQANGAIEELQNQNRRLEDQLKKFQEDVEFRLSGKNGALPAPDAAPSARPMKKSDAFDPANDPNAVGAPRQIGTAVASPPLAKVPAAVGAPLDLSHGGASNSAPTAEEPPPVVASTGADPVREDFNAAMESYRQGQYEQAEQLLRAFIAHNSGNRLVPDAVFYLGETYFQRSRPREAAEQYLKVSTDYSKSTRAPEGLLRLGQTLAALGSNDQACATFAEVGRRYPAAGASVKKTTEREMQKDHC